MAKHTVRPATGDDIPAIQGVARRTWYATYAGHIPNEDIERFVSGAYSQAQLERTLERLGDGAIVADTGAEIAGYAMVGLANEGMAELYAIYVLPRYHGQGIGKALWSAAAEHATAAGFPALALWVLESNEPARRFYERQGAVATEERDFRVGDGVVVETRYVLWLAPV